MSTIKTITEIVLNSLAGADSCCAAILSIRDKLRKSINVIYDYSQELRVIRDDIDDCKDRKADIIERKNRENDSFEIEMLSELIKEVDNQLENLIKKRDDFRMKRESEKEKRDHLENGLHDYMELCNQYVSILEDEQKFIQRLIEEKRNPSITAFQSANQSRYGRTSSRQAVSKIKSDNSELDLLLLKIKENIEICRRLIKQQTDNLGYWAQKEGGFSIDDSLAKCNPGFSMESSNWSENCQRCVPTYEMLRRGYDVTARDSIREEDHIAGYSDLPWEHPDIHYCVAHPVSEITDTMKKWGNGARAQIRVRRKNKHSGHTFVAENINGEIVFVDPQTGEVYSNPEFVFFGTHKVNFFRIDTLQPNDYILECCKSN